MTQLKKLFPAAVLILALAMSTSAACSAQDWAKAALNKSSRHGEYVTIPEASGRKLQAFVVYPEVKDKAPVVVLIHEIFGESDWFKEMADELAGAGYIVVAPDLLSGFGPMAMPTKAGLAPSHMKPCPGSSAGMTAADMQSCMVITSAYINSLLQHVTLSGMGCDPMDCAAKQEPKLVRASMNTPQLTQKEMDHSHMQMPNTGAAYMPVEPGGTSAFPDQSAVTKAVMSLPDAQVLIDLDAAADYGKKLPAANGKLYVAGFCWGGGKSFLFATHRKDLSAAFVFYGPPPPADAMKNITAPVYGFYAGNDARISATIPQTELDMKAAGKTYEPVTYNGAGHGFMRAGEAPDASAANSAARAAGFRRLVTLLGGMH